MKASYNLVKRCQSTTSLEEPLEEENRHSPLGVCCDRKCTSLPPHSILLRLRKKGKERICKWINFLLYIFLASVSDINIKVKPNGELGHAMWTESFDNLREETQGSTLLNTQPLVLGLHPALDDLVPSSIKWHDNTTDLMGLYEIEMT